MSAADCIHSNIWFEEAVGDEPFTADVCYCYGYDVYGEILTHAGWIEYLYLLFKGERPTATQARLLEKIALAIANPGPRDHSIRAAMNGGVGGSDHAACLIAALAVGAGDYGGAGELSKSMALWLTANKDIHCLQQAIHKHRDITARTNPADPDLLPGFATYAEACNLPVRQTLDCMSQVHDAGILNWLARNRTEVESIAGIPLAMTGVIAAAMTDLEFSTSQAEMLYLILRLPGAAVHALEQTQFGWKHYPFFKAGLHIEDDPAKRHENREGNDVKQQSTV
ncbi:MAG: citryl-CoA lyase [Gammaproteobacteria bacterium]|nr:citryl-CoA lyase [Gammaproteobacteria bacterium]MDH5652802.1 citryl-CoA lyase [Gammaproteobacteria bacterium]